MKRKLRERKKKFYERKGERVKGNYSENKRNLSEKVEEVG